MGRSVGLCALDSERAHLFLDRHMGRLEAASAGYVELGAQLAVHDDIVAALRHANIEPAVRAAGRDSGRLERATYPRRAHGQVKLLARGVEVVHWDRELVRAHG